MAKIDVKPEDHKDVTAKVDALLAGKKDFPITVTLNHNRKPGVVLPIIGVYEIIPQKTDVPITLWSRQQAWDMVSQLAHIAQMFSLDPVATIDPRDEAPTAPATTKRTTKESEVKV